MRRNLACVDVACVTTNICNISQPCKIGKEIDAMVDSSVKAKNKAVVPCVSGTSKQES